MILIIKKKLKLKIHTLSTNFIPDPALKQPKVHWVIQTWKETVYMGNLSVTPERNHCFKTNPQVAHLQIGPKTFLGRISVLWPEIDSDIKMPIRKNHVYQFFIIDQNHLPQIIFILIEKDKSSYSLLCCSRGRCVKMADFWKCFSVF